MGTTRGLTAIGTADDRRAVPRGARVTADEVAHALLVGPTMSPGIRQMSPMLTLKRCNRGPSWRRTIASLCQWRRHRCSRDVVADSRTTRAVEVDGKIVGRRNRVLRVGMQGHDGADSLAALMKPVPPRPGDLGQAGSSASHCSAPLNLSAGAVFSVHLSGNHPRPHAIAALVGRGSDAVAVALTPWDEMFNSFPKMVGSGVLPNSPFRYTSTRTHEPATPSGHVHDTCAVGAAVHTLLARGRAHRARVGHAVACRRIGQLVVGASNRARQGAGIGRILGLAAAHPQDAVIHHERRHRGQHQDRNRDLNEDGPLLVAARAR